MSDPDFTPELHELARQHVAAIKKERAAYAEQAGISEIAEELIELLAGGQVAIVAPGFSTS